MVASGCGALRVVGARSALRHGTGTFCVTQDGLASHLIRRVMQGFRPLHQEVGPADPTSALCAIPIRLPEFPLQSS